MKEDFQSYDLFVSCMSLRHYIFWPHKLFQTTSLTDLLMTLEIAVYDGGKSQESRNHRSLIESWLKRRRD
jgi:hypothetical protein